VEFKAIEVRFGMFLDSMKEKYTCENGLLDMHSVVNEY
jgi:hypothetical protein